MVKEPTDDALAFRAAVRDVKPLTHPTLPEGLAKPRPRVRRKLPPLLDDLNVSMPLLGETEATVGAEEPLKFQRPGVQAHVVRRLRRGSMPIEGELDLHGLTQAVAREQLTQFLSQNRAAGRRCVRIIHGKGYRSGGRGPILKMAVDRWLKGQSDVLAFTSARPIDGGTGAVYVLLRA